MRRASCGCSPSATRATGRAACRSSPILSGCSARLPTGTGNSTGRSSTRNMMQNMAPFWLRKPCGICRLRAARPTGTGIGGLSPFTAHPLLRAASTRTSAIFWGVTAASPAPGPSARGNRRDAPGAGAMRSAACASTSPSRPAGSRRSSSPWARRIPAPPRWISWPASNPPHRPATRSGRWNATGTAS